MDPVSQTQASEELALRGLAVVGWYHSHPTFAPIPSVRDIETQAKFQVFVLDCRHVVNFLCKCDLVCSFQVPSLVNLICSWSSFRVLGEVTKRMKIKGIWNHIFIIYIVLRRTTLFLLLKNGKCVGGTLCFSYSRQIKL